MPKDIQLDRLRQDLRSRNGAKVSNAFFKIARSSEEVSDLDLLVDAYVKLFDDKNHKKYLSAIADFIMRLDCDDHFSDIITKRSRPRIRYQIAKHLFETAIFLKPENTVQLLEKFLRFHLESQGTSFIAKNDIRLMKLEDSIERLIKSEPELADKLFEDMKNSAERIGADYPFFLFKVFGEEGKEYLLEKYRSISATQELWGLDNVLEGLPYFKDERILQIALSEQNEIILCVAILKNYIEDERARSRLAELLGSSNDFVVNASILRILADADCDDIADKVLEKTDSLMELALFRANWEESQSFAKFKAISEMFLNIATICGEKFKDKLLALSKSSRAELRGPALHALGMFGEVKVLTDAFRNDKSKWSKFFISLGLILSQQEAAVNQGMAFVNDFIGKIIPKGQGGLEFRKDLIDFVKVNLGDIPIPVSTILQAFADQYSMEAGIIFLRIQLNAKTSIRELDELRVAIREGIQAIRDSPNYEKAKAALAAIMADINRKKNSLIAVDAEVDKKKIKPPEDKGREGTYRKERRLAR